MHILNVNFLVFKLGKVIFVGETVAAAVCRQSVGGANGLVWREKARGVGGGGGNLVVCAGA